ncbi:unnamed protein product [Medioppia subpectinata]|uniref:Uncharacterized protein n=1 Tax=Medioppia subpectinata TaxID=1979941 RepID=A0A7R9QJU4_9ACAR|nr:unnamed protein product [Medioppia subpectinata]CAG2122108.1 unnamed protein product [Medioppia subpectinata]
MWRTIRQSIQLWTQFNANIIVAELIPTRVGNV